jgi:long-chain acyl-CoA synthetase
MTMPRLPETLVHLLQEAVRRHRKPDALRFKQDRRWVSISSDEVLTRVRRVAMALDGRSIGKGERVALLAESGPNWTIADYGILSVGAVTVPIYPTQPLPQVEYILREQQPRLLFVSTRKQVRRLGPLLDANPDLAVVTFDSGCNGYSSLADFEAEGRTRDEQHPGRYDQLAAALQSSDLASIIYTSGTTGEPKGAMLSHRNIVFDALSAASVIEPGPDDTALSFLPLSHIFERTVLYLALYCGTTICYAESVETVAANMLEVRPTLMTAVPRFFEKVYQRILRTGSKLPPSKRRMFDWALPVGSRWAEATNRNGRAPVWLQMQHRVADRLVFSKWREVVGGRMRRFVSGGAPLSPELAYVFLGAGIPILQGYGLTETSPVISTNALSANRVGTVGRPIPGVELKISEDGEVLTRGEHVFQGYFGKEEATKAAFTADGWFRTGDVGFIDADGYLTITDRLKDLLKTSAGKYVAPQPIENLCRLSSFVDQAVVVGDGRKHVVALIVPNRERLREWAIENGLDGLDGDALLAEAKVLEAVRHEISRLTSHLADYERIKGVALLPNEFTVEGGELTPTMKVRRRFVEEKYRAQIDALYGG